MNRLSNGARKMMIPAITAGMLLGVAGASQAQNFTFTNTFTPNVFTSNTSTTGASTITVSNGASVGTNGTPTNVSLGNIGEITVPGGGSNTFDATNGSYSAVFALTDTSLGLTQNATITGFFGGTADGGLGANAPRSAITNTFTSAPTLFLFFSTGTYMLSNFNYVAPGPQNATPGAFGALVTFTPVPEPGSVAMLVGMGISGAGFLVRRRKNVKKVA